MSNQLVTVTRSDQQKVNDFVSSTLPVIGASLPEEYYYCSLSHCVIDAIYSIGVKYEGVRNVVERYCAFFEQPKLSPNIGEPLSALLRHYDEHGVIGMLDVFKNRQRTSSRNGILKAEAVLLFAEVLVRQGIEKREDMLSADFVTLEAAIAEIPGQGSGISFRYFRMLSGDDSLIKPDRMIERFLTNVTGKKPTADVMQSLIEQAASAHQITPRLLDYLIWNYQRGIDKVARKAKTDCNDHSRPR